MAKCRWIFRPAVVLILAAGGGNAQSRRPDYNFFDSREQGNAASEFMLKAERLEGTLTPPAASDPETTARAFLEDHREQLGLPGASVFSLPLERRYESPTAGLTHLLFRQHYAGIPVFGGDVLAHVTREGSLLEVQTASRWPAGVVGISSPALTISEAADAAARTLAPGATAPSPAPARLVWFPRTGDAALSWELYLHFGPGRWFCAVVDASTGALLFSHNLYREQIPRGSVFRAPDASNPNAARSLEPFNGWPAAAGNCPASIYPAQYRSGSLLNRCWVNSAETAGNNVVACLDATGLNQCDWKAYNAQADFQFPFGNSYALSGDKAADRPAAVTNLFYWNNVLHDWLYGLGFDEAAGNFQADNFGRGGFGGDPVLADAQDGSGLNSSNFATPPDGSSPRMQIFLFTDNGTFLRRDGDFDGGLITHEYVHGLTTRLVGGPGNVNVLPLVQSAALGEGWSDAYACSFTNNPVIGEYVSATPATGIRSVAYDQSPHTFQRFGTLYRRNVGPLSLIVDLPQMHRDGEIWATVLWDLRDALGQPVFEQVITTALKLTAARPSMLDARNAILQAAQAMGIESCVVWKAFARRGFGASAALNHVQTGQPNDTSLSVFESYDQPAACGGTLPRPGAVVFSDDMEGGTNGWTATGLWRLTSRRAAGGSKAWWYGRDETGNYATGDRNSGALTSPAIVLPAGARAILAWDQLFKTEGFGHCYALSAAGCDPYLNYDSGWAQVSRDGGASWETLTTLAHNSDGVAFDHYKVDISRYAGSTIRLRFLFDTLDASLNSAEGWYIDNVSVRRLLTGQPVLGVTPASLEFAAVAGGGSPAAQSLVVSNLDAGVLSWTATASSSGWLSIAPASGTGSATITVTAQTGTLAGGTYSGTVTLSAVGAAGSPAVIPVTLTVAGPAAEWRLDETGAGDGVALADSSGNGRQGVTHGYGSAAFPGVAGGARAFNGFSDWAEMPVSAAFSPSSFTFRVWVKLLSYPAASGWGVVAANYGGNYQGWYVGVHASGRVILSAAGLPSSAPWLVSNAALAVQRWYLITTTYDGTTGEGAIYINGALDILGAFPVFTPQSALPLTLARASWFAGYYLNAVLDEARLLPVRQTPAQALADYQSFPAPPAPPANAGLVADWRLDDTGGTLADSSGNARHGTVSGTAVPGVLNGARSFNGLTECARVPASDAFSAPSFTVRLWVKLLSYPQAAGWGVALADYGGNYQGWYVGVHASGRVIVSVASLPSSAPWLLSSTALALGRWYYLAATYDGAARRAILYINGAADAQGGVAGFTPAPATSVYFARASWYDGYYLNAALDEARVYPAAKTAAEIARDYQSFPAQPLPVAAEWRLDDAGTTLADSSGNGHDGAAHGTAVTPGKRNPARSFNGVSDWIQVPASAALRPVNFAFQAWIKLLSPPPGWGVVTADYDGNYQGWYVGIHSSGRVIFSVASPPASAPWLLSNTALALNTWYHLIVSYDGATRAGTIYLNGAQGAQAVFPGFTPQTATDLFLGRASWYDGYYLNAVLDEVRLLGSAQSPGEVLADYQASP